MVDDLEDTNIDLEARVLELETRLENQRASLEAKFIAMETALATLNSQIESIQNFFETQNSDS